MVQALCEKCYDIWSNSQQFKELGENWYVAYCQLNFFIALLLYLCATQFWKIHVTFYEVYEKILVFKIKHKTLVNQNYFNLL